MNKCIAAINKSHPDSESKLVNNGNLANFFQICQFQKKHVLSIDNNKNNEVVGRTAGERQVQNVNGSRAVKILYFAASATVLKFAPGRRAANNFVILTVSGRNVRF